MTPTEALAAALVAAFRNPVLPGGGSGEFARAQAPHVLAALTGYTLVPVGLVEAARAVLVGNEEAEQPYWHRAAVLRAALDAIEEVGPCWCSHRAALDPKP